MVDDGFLIGFEDSSGNFVEVGRFNNTANDVTQPLEIKHAKSGERITLDSSGFETRSVTSTDSVTVTDGEASGTLHYGSDQDRSNAGSLSVALGIGSRASVLRSVAVGFDAARNNTGNRLTAVGFRAGKSINSPDCTTVGFSAGEKSTGEDTSAFGSRAAEDNSGNKVSVFGFAAGQSNSADLLTARGVFAAQNNTGARLTTSGVNSARGDGLSDTTTMGDDNIGIGVSAIRNNQASGLIAIGQQAGINAQTDDQLIITDRNGNRRMVMDLTNGNLKIDGTLTENATL
jgi:hypothetical protein